MKSLPEQFAIAKEIVQAYITVVERTKMKIAGDLVKGPAISFLYDGSTRNESGENNNNNNNQGVEADPLKEVRLSARRMLLNAAVYNAEKISSPEYCKLIYFNVDHSSKLLFLKITAKQSGDVSKKLLDVKSVIRLLKTTLAQIDVIEDKMLNEWSYQRENKTNYLVNPHCIGNALFLFFATMTLDQTEVLQVGINFKDLPSNDAEVLTKKTWRVKCETPAAKLLFSHAGIKLPDYKKIFKKDIKDFIKQHSNTHPELCKELQQNIDKAKRPSNLYSSVTLMVQKSPLTKRNKIGELRDKLVNSLFRNKYFRDIDDELKLQNQKSDCHKLG